MVPPPELVDAFLSQAIKLPELDAVDNAQKITAEFLGKALAPGIFSSSELNNMQGEQLAQVFLKKARDAGRWVPLVTAKGKEPFGFGDDHEGIGGLMKRGLVTMKELSNGIRLFIPTEAFVEFVKNHLTK